MYVKAVLFLDVFNFLKKMFQVAILVNIDVILVNVLTTLLFAIKLWTVLMIIQMKETVLPQVRLSILSMYYLSIQINNLINNRRMFNLEIDDLAEKPYIPQKLYFNEFVANVWRDNIGIVIFDL